MPGSSINLLLFPVLLTVAGSVWGQDSARQLSAGSINGASYDKLRTGEYGDRIMVPTNQVQQLEGLVAEVEQVAAVGVEAVGGGTEDQVGQLTGAGPLADGRQQGSLGAVYTVASARGVRA